MSFYEIYGSQIVNRRNIRAARLTGTHKDPVRDTLITLDDGGNVLLRGNHLDRIVEEIGIIPAEPGYRTVTHWADEEGDGVHMHPIIAWRIEGGLVSPLTPDWGMNDGDFAILYPDGRVISPGDQWWPNVEEWLVSAREEWAKKLAKRLAKMKAEKAA
jgi:hypothetical protein